jgi:hypothetical protein
MANDSIGGAEQLYQLATDVQIQAHRIRSLIEAIDETLDGSMDAEAEGRALDYVALARDAAARVSAAGEQIEHRAMQQRLGTGQ